MTAPCIIQARVSSAENNLGHRFWNPQLRWGVKHAVFVELDTACGLTGLGECWCFDRSPMSLATFLHDEVLPDIVGQTLDDVPEIVGRLERTATLTARHGILASAISGLDLAAWDLRAQTLGIPLWRSLSEDGPGEAHLYASGGLYGEGKGPTALAEELKGYVDRGFPAVKMKVGGASEAEDVQRVRAVRERIGPAPRLMIDAVYSFDRMSAARFYEKVAAFGIDAFQSPIPAEDTSGMRQLRQQGIPVTAIEAEYRSEVLAELIEGSAVAMLQLSPIACGGPSRIAGLIGRLRGTGIQMTLETSSTAIATVAAAQIAAAWKEIRDVEVHQFHQLFFDQIELSNFKIVSPWRLSETPGLGVTLDKARTTPRFELVEKVPHRDAIPHGKVSNTEPIKKRPPLSAASQT